MRFDDELEIGSSLVEQILLVECEDDHCITINDDSNAGNESAQVCSDAPKRYLILKPPPRYLTAYQEFTRAKKCNKHWKDATEEEKKVSIRVEACF